MKKQYAYFEDRTYPLYYGRNILKQIADVLNKHKTNKKTLIVSNHIIKKF